VWNKTKKKKREDVEEKKGKKKKKKPNPQCYLNNPWGKKKRGAMAHY
jgi:hypothetical protein